MKIFEEILLSSLTSLCNQARLAIGCGGCFPWEQRSSLEAVSRSVVCLLDLISLIVFLRFFSFFFSLFLPTSLHFWLDTIAVYWFILYCIIVVFACYGYWSCQWKEGWSDEHTKRETLYFKIYISSMFFLLIKFRVLEVWCGSIRLQKCTPFYRLKMSTSFLSWNYGDYKTKQGSTQSLNHLWTSITSITDFTGIVRQPVVNLQLFNGLLDSYSVERIEWFQQVQLSNCPACAESGRWGQLRTDGGRLWNQPLLSKLAQNEGILCFGGQPCNDMTEFAWLCTCMNLWAFATANRDSSNSPCSRGTPPINLIRCWWDIDVLKDHWVSSENCLFFDIVWLLVCTA